MKIILPKAEQVISRVKSWYNAKRFVPWHLREVLLGLLINFGTIELSAFKLLKQDVKAGDLPPYILDVVILVMGCLEVVIAPAVAWWGSRKRRTTLTMWVAVASACCLLWFAIPDASERESSEYCDTNDRQTVSEFKQVSIRTGIRVGILFLSCTVFMVCRVAVWSHGLAYIEDYAPDVMGFYFGIVLLARVVTLLIDEELMTSPIDTSLSLQTGFILIGMLVYLVPLPFLIPKTAPVVNGVQKILPPMEETGFLVSISRICNNRLAISQMIAMGLLAASLWGFAYHESDIVKLKYSMLSRGNDSMMYSELLQYGFAMFIVAYYGEQLSAPILKQFSSLQAVKQAISMSVIALVLYAVLAVYPTCDKGEVAELRSDHFVLPQCSLNCGCGTGYEEFLPVCVLEDMTTYFSPCHAGCSGSDTLNGLKIYTNCTCSTTHALPGACAKDECTFAFYLYRSIFIALAIVVLLGVQAQGMLVVRAVEGRDKSLALGLASSAVAAFALVLAHLGFVLINGLTCRWYTDHCQWHSAALAPAAGAASAVLALLSALVGILAFIHIKREHKKKADQQTEQNTEI